MASKRIVVDLLERLDLAQAKVDRANSIIRDVKILGHSSPNKHGMRNVTGTDYLPAAHAQARGQYEGMQVNVGHPPRTDPDAERDPRDRNGVLFDVHDQGGETFGSWQLIPNHPMTQEFLDCAENPRLHSQFALSHNAKGYGDVREGRYQIDEIPLVRSVDVVTRGGTNSTIFESREIPMPKQPFKTILAAAEPGIQARFKNLLESMEDLCELTCEAPAAGGGEAGYEAHTAELLKGISTCPDLTDGEKLTKTRETLKLLDDADPVASAAVAAADAAAAAEVEAEAARVSALAGTVLESREMQELQMLRGERKCRDLCESLEFTPNPIQLKCLNALTTDTDRRSAIKDYKASKAAPATGPGRARTAGTRNVLESRESTKRASTKDAFAADLLS